MGEFSGKHAVVTGGGRGMGVSIAESLAKRGATVSLIGRTAATLTATAEKIKSAHGVSVATAVADVSDEAALAAAFAQLKAAQGPVTILVNNAGITPSAPFLKADNAMWRNVLDVDLMSAVYGCRQALPDMLAAGWGRIVNIGSTAGLTGMPYITAYCAAKHALIGLTRSLAMETVKKNVTVNAICPGYVDTDVVSNAIANITSKTGRSREEALANLVSHNPQGRLVAPEEIGETVAWLCGPGAASVTGQSILLAGGELM